MRGRYELLGVWEGGLLDVLMNFPSQLRSHVDVDELVWAVSCEASVTSVSASTCCPFVGFIAWSPRLLLLRRRFRFLGGSLTDTGTCSGELGV